MLTTKIHQQLCTYPEPLEGPLAIASLQKQQSIKNRPVFFIRSSVIHKPLLVILNY